MHGEKKEEEKEESTVTQSDSNNNTDDNADTIDICSVEFWIGLNDACKTIQNFDDSQEDNTGIPLGEKLCTFHKSDDRLPDDDNKNNSLTHDQSTCGACKNHEIDLKGLKEHRFEKDNSIEKVCIRLKLATQRDLDLANCALKIELKVQLLQSTDS